MRWPPVILVYSRYFCAISPMVMSCCGRDFAGGDPGNDRIGAVLLDIGEKVVVGVLQGRLVARQHELVPARGENRCDRGLADIAAEAASMLAQQLVERAQTADAHQMEQLLSRDTQSARKDDC